MTNLFLSVAGISISVSLTVVALVLAAPVLNKRYAVKWKYFIWIFLALRLLVPFSGDEIRAAVNRPAAFTAPGDTRGGNDQVSRPLDVTESRQWITVELPRQMADPVVQPSENNGREITLLDILALVWLGGCLCIILFYLSAYIRYRMCLKNEGIPVEDGIVLNLLGQLLTEMELKRSLPIIEYDDAASPMVIGFVRPVLVLPKGQYNMEEMYFILKHELIHLKRHDVYLKLLFLTAGMVHWFNPVIWLMQKEAVVDMELSCDEMVVQGAGFAERKAYTETLISTLHKSYEQRAVLSTQFYGGKQVMKKRFKNILIRMNKKNGLLMLLCAAVLTVSLGMLVGCSVMSSDQASTEEGIIMDGIDVPDVVLEEAKAWAASSFTLMDENADYTNWRIRSLSHCYTYDNFDGIVLQVYRMNCEFWSGTPENILFAGGKEMLEDGWVTDEYPDSRYLIFRQEGDSLFFLMRLFENDCFPGDDVFTGDLRRRIGDLDASVFFEGEMPLMDPEDNEEVLNSRFWELDETQGTENADMIVFTTGLQLSLPAGWRNRVAMSVETEGDRIERLVLSTKDKTEAGFSKVLFYLSFVSKEGYDADNPYSIYGRKTDSVLGTYSLNGEEYALIFEIPQLYYIGAEPAFQELVADNQDLSESISEVQIVTDSIQGFTECGLDDLDWIISWKEAIEAYRSGERIK